MANKVDPPGGVAAEGKHYYSIWRNTFEIDTKYIPIKPIGKGAYGIVCSAKNTENNEKVAIKKIGNAFENRIDAMRTLREIKLLRQLAHDNIIALKDVMTPVSRSNFKDVYLVYDLMDTDLHQIIKSSQALTDDHCQYFIYQVSIVHICEGTFTKRLIEFENTDSGCLTAIINIANEDDNYLQEAWEHILMCLSRFEHLHLLGEGAPPDATFFTVPHNESEKVKQPMSPVVHALKRKGPVQLQQAAAAARPGSYDSFGVGGHASGLVTKFQALLC